MNRAGLQVIDRLHISSGKTLCFLASSAFPIYLWWLWCTPIIYTTICLMALPSCYHGLAINFLYGILWTYHLPTILTSGAPNREPIFCVVVPDYINLLTLLQHTWALSSNLVIAHKGLQGASIILQYPLHYKDNLTTICVFMLYRYCT